MPKARPTSMNRLFLVQLAGGRSNATWQGFYEAAMALNGKVPDFGGINNAIVLGTHHDEITIAVMIGDHIDDMSDGYVAYV